MNQTLIDALSGIADAIRAKDTSLVGTTMNAWEMPSKIANIPTGGGGQVDKYGVTLNGILGNVDSGGNLLREGEHFSLSSSAITSIPSYYFQRSFYGKNIDKVDLPNLVSIGNWAFESAAPSSPSLSSVSMPSLESVSQYGLQYAFRNCPSMKSIDLDSVQEIQQYGMQGCCYNDPQLSSFSMQSLENVAPYGMFRCLSGDSSLEEVCLPSLTSVENYGLCECFKDCTSLRRVEMPLSQAGNNSLDSTFNGCSSLEEVDFSEATSVPTLSNINCFANTNETYKIYVPTGMEETWANTGNWASPEIQKHIVGYVYEFTGLTFAAKQANSTVALTKTSSSAPTVYLNYSLDNGQTWSAYTVGDTITLANVGDTVCFTARQDNSAFASGSGTSATNKFTMSGELKASGDLNSLLFVNYANPGTYPQRGLQGLFSGCASLTDVDELELKCDSVPLGFYAYMFQNCGITKGPMIYFSSVDMYGLVSMFSGCSSLSEIKLINYTSAMSSSQFQNWVTNVAASGTFYYNGPTTTHGTSAIPTGWTIQSF